MFVISLSHLELYAKVITAGQLYSTHEPLAKAMNCMEAVAIDKVHGRIIPVDAELIMEKLVKVVENEEIVRVLFRGRDDHNIQPIYLVESKVGKFLIGEVGLLFLDREEMMKDEQR